MLEVHQYESSSESYGKLESANQCQCSQCRVVWIRETVDRGVEGIAAGDVIIDTYTMSASIAEVGSLSTYVQPR